MLSYLDLTTTDPAFNLAAEEYVFDRLPRDRMYVMLWRNDNAIIIGKHQNTHAQINETFVREQGIRVVRRLSGGGAVYHDLGNLNFTIIADAQASTLDFGRFCGIIVRALARLGVTAEINGRNDMTIDGKKFSGNAQYLRAGRVMHHGTLLFDSDMGVLSQALQVDEEKIRAKGVKSVRSRVTNIRPYLQQDITLDVFRQTLLSSILEEYPGEAYTFTQDDLAAIHAIRQTRYDTWDWNWGQSPACTVCKRRRFEGCGTVEAYMTLTHGRIESIDFRGDFFSVQEPAVLAQRLTGCRPDLESLAPVLQDVPVGSFFRGLTDEALLSLLTQ